MKALSGFFQIMHSEIQRYPKKIHRIYHTFIDELFETLASYFKKIQKNGILKGFDAKLRTRVFLGMFYLYFIGEEIMMSKKYRAGQSENL